MKTVYTIFDRTANDTVGGPFALTVFRTDEQAIRFMYDNYTQPNSALSAHPDDYELRALGYIDDFGKITVPNEAPVVIITGTQIASMVAAQHNSQLQKVS